MNHFLTSAHLPAFTSLGASIYIYTGLYWVYDICASSCLLSQGDNCKRYQGVRMHCRCPYLSCAALCHVALSDLRSDFSQMVRFACLEIHRSSVIVILWSRLIAGAISITVAFPAARPEYGPKKYFFQQGCSRLLLYNLMWVCLECLYVK